MSSSIFDVVVVGAGCAGLWCAREISKIGARVLIVDKANVVASGPSTRNGGYIHGGGFHAAVIEDAIEAEIVAKNCWEGLQRYRVEFSSAIVHPAASAHLLSVSHEMAHHAVSQWDKTGVSYQLRTRAKTKASFPAINADAIIMDAIVEDLVVNYRIVYQMLLTDLRLRGGELWLDADVTNIVDGHLSICMAGEIKTVRTHNVIYCTGYSSALTKRIKQLLTEIGLEIQLYKSHVLTIDSLFLDGFLTLDHGELSIVPQGGYSTVCRSQDDLPVLDPNFLIVAECVMEMKKKLTQLLLPGAVDASKITAHSCLKPDIGVPHNENKRSVNSRLLRLSDSEYLALPGKATEAPLLADETVRILSGSYMSEIAQRPGEVR